MTLDDSSLPYKIVVFLPQDTIDHMDALARTIGKQNDAQPTRSEAVKYLVRQHWKKAMVKKLEKKVDKPKLVI